MTRYGTFKTIGEIFKEQQQEMKALFSEDQWAHAETLINEFAESAAKEQNAIPIFYSKFNIACDFQRYVSTENNSNRVQIVTGFKASSFIQDKLSALYDALLALHMAAATSPNMTTAISPIACGR